MNRFRKKFVRFIATLTLSVLLSLQIAAAVYADTPRTVLPEATVKCKEYTQYTNIIAAYKRADKTSVELANTKRAAKNAFENDYTREQQYQVIACTIKSGRFHLFMAPYMIRYVLELIIGLAGLICTIFVIVGAYQYMIGSVADNKQKGKETIRNALIGLTITLLSWLIVNIVQVAVTGGGG
ncbi:hypothetical protein HOG48_00825 [Candidatus Peregrinibacteria bacterium]|jgi:hypothetical protein|nr:hypothetical protein [Candidatus Peregrinibacteria bacterium]